MLRLETQIPCNTTARGGGATFDWPAANPGGFPLCSVAEIVILGWANLRTDEVGSAKSVDVKTNRPHMANVYGWDPRSHISNHIEGNNQPTRT